MKICGRSRWRVCKMLVLAIVLLHVVQLLWFYFRSDEPAAHDMHKKLAAQQSKAANDNLRENLHIARGQRKGKAEEGIGLKAGEAVLAAIKKNLQKSIDIVPNFKDSGGDLGCTRLVPFRDIAPDTISTFDIPDVANYSLDKDGKYFLPRMDTVSRVGSDDDDTVHVTLVPFSHSDPGYGMTMEGYYSMMTKNVLDLMVDKLNTYRNMTFQFAESVFLERWFRDIIPARREQVKEIIKRGQLEIVLGGWVMPDEALTRYGAVIDQLIEGHRWVTENLGVVPENAWINDPFGYSSTMPYLWKASGIENMVILRIHQAVKAYLMSKHSTEFMWRPYWERTDGSDILCNLMPYEGYWNSNVCGPKESVCKLFNFLHLHGGGSTAKAVDAHNVKQLSETLYEQYKFTASFYKYNHLIIFLGEDNSYTSSPSWDNTYKNYDYLMNAINNNPTMKMHIKFGTIKSYFDSLRKKQKTEIFKSPSGAFPVLSGDFFPYSDWEHAYWTGYYTTRPWLKKFSRVLESVMRSADIFSVIAHNFCVKSETCPNIAGTFQNIHEDLRTARRELGMFQHHDGITGTSLPYVVEDYVTRLTKGLDSANNALKLAVLTIMTKGNVNSPYFLQLNSPRLGPKSWIQDGAFNFKANKLMLIIANPLERSRTDVVTVIIAAESVAITAADKPELKLPYQVTASTSQTGKAGSGTAYAVSFAISIKPFTIQKYVIEQTTEHVPVTQVVEIQSVQPVADLSIENSKLKLTFNSKTGNLDTLTDKTGRVTTLNTGFFKYTSVKSGAYLFGPAGPAEEMKQQQPAADIKITKGPIYSEMKIIQNTGFMQTVRLYNISGEQSEAVHIRNEIDMKMNPSLRNSEIVWRLKTDVKSDQFFFTDQNGFQYMGRKTYPNRQIESNFYPLTTMAFIEDDTKRLAVHVAQPHGVASLESGWLELMLDRTMDADDKRGLGQGVLDRVMAVSDMVVQVEYKTHPQQTQEPRYNYPTIGNLVINEQLQNPLNVFAVKEQDDAFLPSMQLAFANEGSIPCDVTIVGLRHVLTNDLAINGTSVVVHRKPYSCMYSDKSDTCAVPNLDFNFNNLLFGQSPTSSKSRKIQETSLSHLHVKRVVSDIEDVKPKPQELRSFFITS